MNPGKRTAPGSGGRDADTGTIQWAKDNPADGQDIDAILEMARRWENSAREIVLADDLTDKQKFLGLLDMMRRARRSDHATFLEAAVWRACRQFVAANEANHNGGEAA